MNKNALTKYVICAVLIACSFLINKTVGYILFLAFLIYTLYSERSVFYQVFASRAYRKGNTDKAIGWLEKACCTAKSKPAVKILYGYLLLKTGKLEKSEKVFEELLNSNIDNDSMLQAKSNYALVLWKKGQLKDGIKMLEDVFSSYKNTTIYGSLGYLLVLDGDMNKALNFNKEAYEYNSSDAVILDNLGYTYYKIGNIKKAEEIYQKLVSLNPSFPEAYYNYSCVLKNLGTVEKALEMAKKAKNYKMSYLSNLEEKELDDHIKELEALVSTKSK
ncbi:MAG TPA: tetratricopeptide repeat protein [Acetivibrio sp.]|uniref:tetratricopeptide repeat protein n=1 Tax=Acetivibrio sp. TaxID=1872092 RepID=UPI002CAFE9D3|nr:tetratricopeptide repeat protein [Acetivibrio sp.]HOM01258.1 tetratricopeptide repeat protein [Acetivibrio sp.]